MKSNGPLILAVLLLACGLTIIFAYGVGTAGFNAAYPFSAANLNLSIATAGPAAVGGLGLTALGLLLLLWALVCAIVGLASGVGSDQYRMDRAERKRLEQQQKFERSERKRLEQQALVVKQEERLKASYPRD
ncbi:MAG: hypothetical protein ABR987_14970 [Terracidiphilus sp.]|jgi:hypothetical protein